MKPQDPAKQYQARGMALITITAPASGPIAIRQDFRISGDQAAFGGFASLLGIVPADGNNVIDAVEHDVYLLGITPGGLQMARVKLRHITTIEKYTYFDPKVLIFSKTPPSIDLKDPESIYLPGSFSSGSMFYSPYFATFVMIYFNKFADSTFYVRYLDLDNPIQRHAIWVEGGKYGKGIQPEDAEALVRYSWSPEQKLYVSPTGIGGFNYAGTAHPEYFNRQYFARSVYPAAVKKAQRKNDWYGSGLVKERDAGGDGKYVLLSWTSQTQTDDSTGLYEIQMTVVQFGDIPEKPKTNTSSAIPTGRVKSAGANLNVMQQGWLVDGNTLGLFLSGRLWHPFRILSTTLKIVLLLNVLGLRPIIL